LAIAFLTEIPGVAPNYRSLATSETTWLKLWSHSHQNTLEWLGFSAVVKMTQIGWNNELTSSSVDLSTKWYNTFTVPSLTGLLQAVVRYHIYS
jgi:hypothetical protein